MCDKAAPGAGPIISDHDRSGTDGWHCVRLDTLVKSARLTYYVAKALKTVIEKGVPAEVP